MMENAASTIVTAFVAFVLTNLGWILFRKKTETDQTIHDEPCTAHKLLEREFKGFQGQTKNSYDIMNQTLKSCVTVLEKNIDTHERRINTHSQELDVFRSFIAQKNERDKFIEESLKQITLDMTEMKKYIMQSQSKGS